VRRHLQPGPETLADPRLAEYVQVCINETAPLLGHEQREAVRRRVLAELCGLGTLELWLDDPAVTEVAVNASTEVWVDRSGRMERVDDLVPGELGALVERVIAPLGLRFDLTSPIVDARLSSGHRMCAVLEPLAVDGTCLSIRRFALQHVTLQSFAPEPVQQLLASLVHRRCNVVVSGATSSGKTTMLNALAGIAPTDERIITIEDTAELRLQAPHVVRLEARPATPDGVGAIGVGQLLRAALRLRPDRLVVGEVRGAEAYDMVQALNTGHDGSMATVHANSPGDALRRIASLAELGAPGQSLESIAEQVRSSIDIIVHVARTASGRRYVHEVAEVAAAGTDGPGTRTLATAHDVLVAPTRSRRAEDQT
jgi:pilus assembly protein CpaF